MPTVVLLGTLDTKGREYAFLRDRLLEHGLDVLVVDAGVGEPVGLEPDVPRTELEPDAATPIYAAYKRGRLVPPKVRAFISFMRERFRSADNKAHEQETQ